MPGSTPWQQSNSWCQGVLPPGCTLVLQVWNKKSGDTVAVPMGIDWPNLKVAYFPRKAETLGRSESFRELVRRVKTWQLVFLLKSFWLAAKQWWVECLIQKSLGPTSNSPTPLTKWQRFEPRGNVVNQLQSRSIFLQPLSTSSHPTMRVTHVFMWPFLMTALNLAASICRIWGSISFTANLSIQPPGWGVKLMHHCFPDISGLWVINSYFKGSGAGSHTSFSSFQNPELVAGHQGSQGRPALSQCQKARHVWTRVSPSRIHEDGKWLAFIELFDFKS